MKLSSCQLSEGVATVDRERDSLTLIHSCHRTRNPFGHILVERSCGSKHCKREGATKIEKDQPTRQTTKKYRSRNKTDDKTCENCEQIKLEVLIVELSS